MPKEKPGRATASSPDPGSNYSDVNAAGSNEHVGNAQAAALRPIAAIRGNELTIVGRNYPPSNYVEAKGALAKLACGDECKQWADKAHALKSYAKQMSGRALENYARRVKDRAVRQGGKLLAQVKAERGGDRKSKDRQRPVDRKTAANAAGLSPGQAKEMQCVATVPEPQFDAMVEASKPATVGELAEAGTKKDGRPGKPISIKPWCCRSNVTSTRKTRAASLRKYSGRRLPSSAAAGSGSIPMTGYRRTSCTFIGVLQRRPRTADWKSSSKLARSPPQL
jgi:hypothetical protein